MEPLNRYLEKVSQVFSFMCFGIIFFIAAAVTFDVVYRYFAARNIVGIFEFTEISLMAATFLGVGLAQLYKRQMRVDFIALKAEARTLHVMDIFSNLLGLIVFGIFFWYGANAWMDAYVGGYVGRGLIRIPRAIPLGFLVVGSFFTCIVLINSLLHSFIFLLSWKKQLNEQLLNDYKEGE